MNKLDTNYITLLEKILDKGVTKGDRTGTGTTAIFGYMIEHDMRDGFPLLTTKKMAWKQIVTELLWFLRGETNIQSLVNDGNNIWVGDAYKKYVIDNSLNADGHLNRVEFVTKIMADDKFAAEWGDLGPIYGKQWRNWETFECESKDHDEYYPSLYGIDQIQNLINDLKTNPDSRRMMVNAWNVGEVDNMVLPPCHYGFQVWTRELTPDERIKIYLNKYASDIDKPAGFIEAKLKTRNIPTRTISLAWNQRSVDTFLGLPFNIASYGLLLEIIAKEVNMIPEKITGMLGDTHLYSDHIEQAKTQISRELEATKLPTLSFNKEDISINDDLQFEDFNLNNYVPLDKIKAPLSN